MKRFGFSPLGVLITIAVVALVGWGLTRNHTSEAGCSWESWYSRNSLGDEVGSQRQAYVCDGEVEERR